MAPESNKAMKTSKLKLHTTIWMNLTQRMLSEISKYKAKECMSYYSIYKSFLKKTGKLNYAVISENTDSSVGNRWEQGMSISIE